MRLGALCFYFGVTLNLIDRIGDKCVNDPINLIFIHLNFADILIVFGLLLVGLVVYHSKHGTK